MTRLSICLQGFTSSYPTGAILEDVSNANQPRHIDSDYCATVEDYVEFARQNINVINDETEINIVVSMDDVGSTAVLEFASEVAKEIRNATRNDL